MNLRDWNKFTINKEDCGMYKVKSNYSDYYQAESVVRRLQTNSDVFPEFTVFGKDEIAAAGSNSERRNVSSTLLVKDVSGTTALSVDFLALFINEEIRLEDCLPSYTPMWMLAKKAADFLNQPEHLSDYCSLFGPAAIELAEMYHGRASQLFPVHAIDDRLYLGNYGGYIELTGMCGFKKGRNQCELRFEVAADHTVTSAFYKFRGVRYEWSIYSLMTIGESDANIEPTVPSFNDNPDYNIPDESDLNS